MSIPQVWYVNLPHFICYFFRARNHVGRIRDLMKNGIGKLTDKDQRTLNNKKCCPGSSLFHKRWCKHSKKCTILQTWPLPSYIPLLSTAILLLISVTKSMPLATIFTLLARDSEPMKSTCMNSVELVISRST